MATKQAEPDDPRVPLRRMGFAGAAYVQFDMFAVNGTIFPERKEQPHNGKFELYDAMRFLEVVFTPPNGARQVRLVPWAHVAWVEPVAER